MADITALNAAVDAAITDKVAIHSISPADVGNAIKAANNELRPYKVYTALLNQNVGEAPVATILENSLGGVPAYNYGDTGDIIVILAGAWPAGRTWCMAEKGGSINVGTHFVDLNRVTDDNLSLRIRGFASAGDYVDGLVDAIVEIRVYNA